MNSEPFGLVTTSGAEAISDDRELKFILRREVSFTEPAEQEVYTSYCYVKEGTGWQKTANTAQYVSLEAFVRAVGRFPGFSRAAAILEEDIKKSIIGRSDDQKC